MWSLVFVGDNNGKMKPAHMEHMENFNAKIQRPARMVSSVKGAITKTGLNTETYPRYKKMWFKNILLLGILLLTTSLTV